MTAAQHSDDHASRPAAGITPWPVPETSTPIVLFGGSFDPPTRAHIRLALCARDWLDPRAWLVLIPAARSPHKQRGPRASDEDRIAMLTEAIADVQGAVIWTDDIDRAANGAPSYMIDTLERAQRIVPDATLRLLIGADQAVAFHRWREPRRIIELAEPIVMLRAPAATEADLLEQLRRADFWSDDELDAWRPRIAEAPVLHVSATEARELLEGHPNSASRENTSRLREVLDDRVLDVIVQRGLYGF